MQVVHVLLHIVMFTCALLWSVVTPHTHAALSPSHLAHTLVCCCVLQPANGHAEVCSHLEDDKEAASKRGEEGEEGEGERKGTQKEGKR